MNLVAWWTIKKQQNKPTKNYSHTHLLQDDVNAHCNLVEVGFASRIDFGKFYVEIENFAKENLPLQKRVFFLYTCAMVRDGFTNSIKEIAFEKEAVILGEYGCRGYNTYDPWKLIGGMNKNHPTETEIQDGINFYKNLLI